MAEQEVAKHTKKVYKIWNSKQHGFWHKMKEFFVEIFIIVFAVSLSIWFHNLSEHSHNKKEANEFLSGLQSDLVNDIEEMRQDSLSFAQQKIFFRYLIDSAKTRLDTVAIAQNMYLFTNRTVLQPNVSRFEALKYSGKMTIIEDKNLLDESINQYEEKIPFVVNSAILFYSDKEKNLISLMDKDMLLARSQVQNLADNINTKDTLVYQFKRTLSAIPYILKNYQGLINQHIKLVQMIEKEIN